MAGGHGGGGLRWLVTYADLITLLLAFFIVLYSMSSADSARYRQVQQAVQRIFVMSEGQSGILDGQGTAVFDTTSVVDPVDSAADPAAGSVGLDGLTEREVVAALAEQLERLAPPGTRGGIEVIEHPEGVTISIYGILLFDSGEADLRPEGRALLASVMRYVEPLPYLVRVEGHTDSVPPEAGPFRSNWELSAARSLTVSRYLIETLAFPPRRLSVASYAEFRPVATNETREGRLRNRRVDLVLTRPTPASGGVE